MRRLTRLGDRGEEGYVAIAVAVFLAALFGALGAISVDVARWYVEIDRTQKAADAAALSAVTLMPGDVAGAEAEAKRMARLNGYAADPTTSVTAKPGSLPSQLAVTVSRTIPNTFGALFGKSEMTISRTGVADYAAPQVMGSPCNNFGNEPGGTAAFGPIGSQRSVPAGANCPQFPKFWAAVGSPESPKQNGDRFATRGCKAGDMGCTALVNNEFDPMGYFFVVRVRPAAVGSPLTVQIYDPSYIEQGNPCHSLPGAFASGSAPNNPNSYVVDAQQRYANASNDFCPGDTGEGTGQGPRNVTSFGMLNPTPTLNPLNSTPVDGCVRQYPGYSALSVANLTQTHPAYIDNAARVLHQWKSLCTFTPTTAGDYYLQARSNVAMAGPINNDGSHRPAVAATHAIFTQKGDDLAMLGAGINRFSVRAYSASASVGSVSVSAYRRMQLFANGDATTTTFNLIQVPPSAAGQSLKFTFFDVGDASQAGTFELLRPTEATGSPVTTCIAAGYYSATLSECRLTGLSAGSGWNGKIESLSARIPVDYSCNFASAGGCWWLARISFPSGSVQDNTTWTAELDGDPVRLVE